MATPGLQGTSLEFRTPRADFSKPEIGVAVEIIAFAAFNVLGGLAERACELVQPSRACTPTSHTFAEGLV